MPNERRAPPSPVQALTSEESSDLLPFALDESPGSGGGGGLLAGAVDSEEALGAFVRMLETAPPLHSLRTGGGGGGGLRGGSAILGGGGLPAAPTVDAAPRMSLAAGMHQLAALREALPAALAT